MHLKLLSGNWRPFCLDLNVLTEHSDSESVYSLPGDFSGLLAPDRVWLMISLSYVVFVPLRVIEQEAETFV